MAPVLAAARDRHSARLRINAVFDQLGDRLQWAGLRQWRSSRRRSSVCRAPGSSVLRSSFGSLGICALLIIMDRPGEKRRASVKRYEGDPLEGAPGTGRIQLVLAPRGVDGVNRIGGVILEVRRDLVDLDRRKAGNRDVEAILD